MFTAYEEINVSASVKLSSLVALGHIKASTITCFYLIALFYYFSFLYLGGQSYDHQCSSWQSSCIVATQVRLKCG